MSAVTHVTEYGLAACAGLGFGREGTSGMRVCTIACDESDIAGKEYIAASGVPVVIPTCPRCAVLRDEALEGRLPKR